MEKKWTAFVLIAFLGVLGLIGCARKQCACGAGQGTPVLQPVAPVAVTPAEPASTSAPARNYIK